jgi:methylglutaconyl-CoA hydratase
MIPTRSSYRPTLLVRRKRFVHSCMHTDSSKPTDAIQVQQVPSPGFGYVRVLLLNRPQARNAISRRLLDSLSHHVEAILTEGGRGPTRALVLASNVDSAFCAGADLKERREMSKEEYVFLAWLPFYEYYFTFACHSVSNGVMEIHRTNAFLARLRSTFSHLATLPIPTISAVSSVALGGGLELALCTHFRVFGSSSLVGLPETRLAIIPGAGGTFRLPRLIGLDRARDMILTGRRVTGAEAYFIGLCNRLIEVTPEEEAQEGVGRDKVLRESIKLALDICEGGPIAIRQALQAVNQFERGEDVENEAYAGVIDTEDRLEALRAFAERRKPVFRGR